VIGRRPLAAIALMLACVAAPVAAAQSAATGARDERPPIEIALDDVREGRFAHGLAQADLALRAAGDDPQRVAGAQFMRAMAFMGLGRRDEARLTARIALDTTEQTQVAAALVSFFLAAGDPDGAQALLGRYLDRFGFRAGDLEVAPIHNLLGWIRQKQGKPIWEALIVRLAGGGFGGDDLAVRDDMALGAARILLARGDLDQAQSLARDVTLRSVAAPALTDRRYEPLWPLLEQSAGPHLERIARAALYQAEAPGKAADAPVAARISLFRAYRDAGLYDLADRVAAPFAATPEELARLGEDGAWLVSDHADMLARRDRLDAADARLAGLTALPIAERPWLISMVINRLDMLVGHGRSAAALPLIDSATASAQTFGSAYAQQLVRELRICALHGVGRDADAHALAADFVAHAADSAGASIDGYMCLDRVADAEALAIKTLGDPDQASDIIAGLQPREADTLHDNSLWSDLHDRLRKLPTVTAALEKAGRVLPEPLWPTPIEPLQ
jgi:hypothetical protein